MKITSSMPWSEYFNLPYINASLLSDVHQSPLIAKHNQDNPSTADHFEFGRAFHTMILEPELAEIEIVFYDGARRKGTKNKSKWDKFREEHAGKAILKPADYEVLRAMQKATYEHVIANDYLSRMELAESTVTWEVGGLAAKSRIDMLASTFMADLKTTDSVENHKFVNSCYRYNYDLKAAFYVDAVKTVTGTELPFKVIAVEKKPPHDVVVFDLLPEVISNGRAKYKRALELLQHCRENNSWPGVAPDREVPLSVPLWAIEKEVM